MERCVRWIKHDKLRQWTKERLETVPEYFWHVPASSSGKYHPEFALGDGGLVRHTRAAVWVALELFEVMNFTNTEEDIVISALILHDTWKQGDGKDNHTVEDHAKIAAEKHCGDAPAGSIRWKVGRAIARHMGKWGEEKPETELEWFVHLCDYVASRKNLKLDFSQLKC